MPNAVYLSGTCYPTDWSAQCEALCRKTGKQCPHRCSSQIPSTFAHNPVLDGNQFTVSGRPARLCWGHAQSFEARKKRLLTVPLIDGGHLGPYNRFGYGSVIHAQDRLDFSKNIPVVRIPALWGVIGTFGKVPEKYLSLPKYPPAAANERPKQSKLLDSDA